MFRFFHSIVFNINQIRRMTKKRKKTESASRYADSADIETNTRKCERVYSSSVARIACEYNCLLGSLYLSGLIFRFVTAKITMSWY